MSLSQHTNPVRTTHGARHPLPLEPPATVFAMSRFFAASDSDDSSSSDEELYSNDEESEQEDSEMGSDDSDDSDSDSGSETGANRFLKDASSDESSDDEDTGRVIKSAKDKRFDELEAVVRQIENAQRIQDWAVIADRTCTRREIYIHMYKEAVDARCASRWWRGTGADAEQC